MTSLPSGSVLADREKENTRISQQVLLSDLHCELETRISNILVRKEILQPESVILSSLLLSMSFNVIISGRNLTALVQVSERPAKNKPRKRVITGRRSLCSTHPFYFTT